MDQLKTPQVRYIVSRHLLGYSGTMTKSQFQKSVNKMSRIECIERIQAANVPDTVIEAAYQHQFDEKEEKRQRRERRQARMNAWRTNCEECSKELTAHTALYNLHIGGPYCSECVEADEEMEGMKWEAKSEFWR
jgi:hypothetical protein